MADLNLDINYFDHLKTKRLVARLKRGADVLPLRLWCYCGKHYARDGRLIGHTADDIEAQIGWWGKAGECVQSMLDIKFLDLDGDTYVVHGWLERSGHLAAFSIRASVAADARWEKERKRRADAQASTSNAQAPPSNAPTNQPTNSTHQTNQPANGSGNGAAGSGLGLGSADAVLEDAQRRAQIQQFITEKNITMNEDVRQNWLDRRDITISKLKKAWAESGESVGLFVVKVDPARRRK